MIDRLIAVYEVPGPAAEAEKLGWCIWDWTDGFRYWDKAVNHALPGMHAALFGPAN